MAPPPLTGLDAPPLIMGINAVIVAVVGGEPCVFTVSGDQAVPDHDHAAFPASDLPQNLSAADDAALPFGPYDPVHHRTLELGLRAFVEAQTPFSLGYVEQLYTFGDRGRFTRPEAGAPHFVSVGYLGLTRADRDDDLEGGAWRPWTLYFPWEDRRATKQADGPSPLIAQYIEPGLKKWAASAKDKARQARRTERARVCFGLDGARWNDEQVLERYELLYEAGLVGEALRDQGLSRTGSRPLGPTMRFDHRRVLATAISRLRAKIKYRPVIFELMPETFTLTELQKTVEAIAGASLHKQNFRRLLDQNGLVEPTGKKMRGTGGRPAEQFRFRRDAIRDRLDLGVKIPRR